jgi:hypothetical protein
MKQAGLISLLFLICILHDGCSPISSPDKIRILSATDSLTAPFPSIVFTPVSNAGSYIILRKLVSMIAYDSVGTTANTSFIDLDSNLIPETTYAYKVQARNVESSESDSALVRTPSFMILYPYAGIAVHIGDTLAVRMKAAYNAKAGIKLVFGKLEATPPGVTGTFYMQSTPVKRFLIPSAFTIDQWNDSLQHSVPVQVSSISDSCYIRIFNYDVPAEDYAVSYGYFRIY